MPASPIAPEPKARLVSKQGDHPLVSPFLIGRGGDSDVVLEDAEVSRRHAMIFQYTERWWLTDMGSRNGVLVNGVRLNHARPLHDGDAVRIGTHGFTFRTAQLLRHKTTSMGVTTIPVAGNKASSAPGAVMCELIVAAANGEILEGDKAARWFFGKTLERQPGAEHNFLPPFVRIWLERQAANGQTGGAPLELQEVNRRVVVTLCRCNEGRYFLLVREESALVAAERLQSLGLSQREAEVMHWVCEGKTNPEIASILGVTIHTVNRHLEHILAKLGVDNRQKAMMSVIERLGV
ncbi:MAG: FHA domain-containing protein [Prosthecobacter sp.]|nr:FHA domain-containing protein [Prosthecobacter sp.]